MSVAVLKNSFHLLIDKIDNENLLSQFSNALIYSYEKEGYLLGSLNKTEKEELLSAYESSEIDKNLISHDEVKRKFEKWLKK